jgi:hypothetical protein
MAPGRLTHFTPEPEAIGHRISNLSNGYHHALTLPCHADPSDLSHTMLGPPDRSVVAPLPAWRSRIARNRPLSIPAGYLLALARARPFSPRRIRHWRRMSLGRQGAHAPTSRWARRAARSSVLLRVRKSLAPRHQSPGGGGPHDGGPGPPRAGNPTGPVRWAPRAVSASCPIASCPATLDLASAPQAFTLSVPRRTHGRAPLPAQWVPARARPLRIRPPFVWQRREASFSGSSERRSRMDALVLIPPPAG